MLIYPSFSGKSFEGVNELIEAMLADEGNNTSETVPSASKEKEISVAMQIKSSTEAENSSQAMTTSEPSTSSMNKFSHSYVTLVAVSLLAAISML